MKLGRILGGYIKFFPYLKVLWMDEIEVDAIEVAIEGLYEVAGWDEQPF